MGAAVALPSGRPATAQAPRAVDQAGWAFTWGDGYHRSLRAADAAPPGRRVHAGAVSPSGAADAEDAVQEAFLQALRYFAGFRGENARAWLLTIVRRVCYGWLERTRRRPWADPEVLEDLPGAADDPETTFLHGERREQLRRAVDALPDPFREVIVLREIQELSYQEIATVTGVPVGTVMSRLSRARRRLQRVLEAEGIEG